MKLIIGIGNPEDQYDETRHNVGFMFLDYIAKSARGGSASGGKAPIVFELDEKLNAMVAKGKIDKTSVVLAKPLSYVNKSGEVVQKILKSYKLKASDLIVVQDDLDIEFGSCKNSFDKNSGGHKGIESIIKSLKTKKFYRLRIGIATRKLEAAREQSDKKRDEFVVNLVLSKFSPAEKEKLKLVFKEVWLRLEQILK